MSKTVEGVRGIPDILPIEVRRWQAFEHEWRQLIAAYGYDEIRLPLLEATALFKRSIGEATDIVEKEMFSFQSRDEKESFSLRPEGTAGCVRAGIEHGLLYHQTQRIWYSGPMFRYERPQKGRYRQFHQIGVEAFGFVGPDIEIEHILMMQRFWRRLKIDAGIRLEVNSIGSLASREHYRQKLVDYFSLHMKDLDEDSQRRLQTNPLRILDSKIPSMQAIILGAPKLEEHLDQESKEHFEGFLSALTDLKIEFSVNPRLVRGLDYYNRTVYEWTTDHLGAQGAVCAGGRYDTLVEQLGGHSTPAVGFALGIERVLMLQETLREKNNETVEADLLQKFGIDIYCLHQGEGGHKLASQWAEALRDKEALLRVIVYSGTGQFKQQFKQADKAGATMVLIFGEQEIQDKTVRIKFLKETKEPVTLLQTELVNFCTTYFNNLILTR
jgi:histidyl-tRNA synthetase